jgi:hypothetical protein
LSTETDIYTGRLVHICGLSVTVKKTETQISTKEKFFYVKNKQEPWISELNTE